VIHSMKTRLNLTLLLPPLICLGLACWLVAMDWSTDSSITLAVTLLCAIWWTTEALPVPVTSLLPLGLFPLLGVLSANEVALAYGSPMILLLMGGFILSVAMETTGAHRQIALRLLYWVGTGSQRRLVLAFMGISALLSMWVSNTATTLMLLPIAIAVLNGSEDKLFVTSLLLGICYGASIGGIGTPIGTPPNLIFVQVYHEVTGQEISFIQWMGWALPVVLLFLPLMGYFLTRRLQAAHAVALPQKQPWSSAQKRILMVFAMTALAWITRKEPFGGWSQLFELKTANDASVVLIAVVVMFLVPDGRGGKLLEWKHCDKVPWGILLLFAGGLCIAKAFVVSGLALKIGDALSVLANLPTLVMIFLLCLAVTFMTEVTSNTATTSLLMPILAASAVAIGVDGALLMVPAAMSASCAFMLPVATAPNAIIYGSNRVPIQTMIRRGFALNLMGVLVIGSVCYLNFF